MIPLLLTAMAWAECDPELVEPALIVSEAAFVTEDLGALAEAIKRARKNYGCAPDDSGLAARLLRSEALLYGLKGDWETAEEHMRGSVAAHPLLPLDGELGQNQRLHLAWLRAQEAPIEWSKGAPSLVNGMVAPLEPDTPLAGNRKRGKARSASRFVAVGLGVAGASLYGAAWASRLRYDDAIEEGRQQDALRHYKTTNALSFGSIGAAVAGVGLVGVSFAL